MTPTYFDIQNSNIGLNDVLLGRGGGTNNHDGNQKFRVLVAKHQQQYLQARKRDKVVIAREIVQIVKANGGRFLKRGNDDATWIEVPDKRAQEKASQALREGLDVRNHAFRPSKMIKTGRRNSDFSSSDSSTAAIIKKPRHVVGKAVVTIKSPLSTLHLGQQNTANTQMPELKDEFSEPVFLLYQPPPLSATQLEHSCAV